ncbi:MAG: SDR family NAD(P)-dependent oxidoreductase [Chloroflexota bacterium]
MPMKKDAVTTETALVSRPRALIIGASSGIGAALARKLAREGYRLALLARREELLQDLCTEINDEVGEGRAVTYPHDVKDFDQAEGLFKTILRDMGHLDVVAYVAGVMPAVDLWEFAFDKDREMVAVNLLGAMVWLGLAARLLTELGGGHIVGVSSIAGERGRVKNPGYHASKAGLSVYLESLRNRLSRKGVHVLTVKPGFVNTTMLQAEGRTFWVVSPEKVAEDISKALRTRKQVIYTPARWCLVAWVVRNLPSFIFRRLSF